MSTHVTVTITSSGSRDTLTLTLEENEPGDNPRYVASQVRHALAEIGKRAEVLLTKTYGDIEKERGD